MTDDVIIKSILSQHIFNNFHSTGSSIFVFHGLAREFFVIGSQWVIFLILSLIPICGVLYKTFDRKINSHPERLSAA